GGGEDDGPSFGFVAADRLARARADIRRNLIIGEAFDQRLEVARMNAPPEEQPVVDLLEPPAVDQPRDVGEHRKRHERKEQQPPRRALHGAVQQEGRVGGPPRYGPVHVVDREIAHPRPARMASTSAWSSGLSTSIAAMGLLISI